MRGAGWYPDEQLRLLCRARARYDEGRLVHEVADVDGPLGQLNAHLIHLNYASFPEFWAKQRRYAALTARDGPRRAPARPRPAGRRQPGELWRRYMTLDGFVTARSDSCCRCRWPISSGTSVRQARQLSDGVAPGRQGTPGWLARPGDQR